MEKKILMNNYESYNESYGSLFNFIENIITKGEITQKDKDNLPTLQNDYNEKYLNIKSSLKVAEEDINQNRNDNTLNQITQIQQQIISNIDKTQVNTSETALVKLNVKDLEAENVVINGKLTANEADIKNLKADNVTITGNLNAANAEIGKLKANDVTVNGKLEANTAEINSLKADVAEIDTLLAGNITADNIQAGSITTNEIASGTITAGSGVIANGAIGSAQISELEASKINSGTIDTSRVTVAGPNSNLKLSGNRLQVFQGIGSKQVERVSLGDIQGDGTQYGFLVRGADGKTVIMDENGVTNAGITNGSITNEKIGSNANIDGAKLNINSVINKINTDGSETIQGTKIDVDGTNLSAKLSTITTTQTNQGKKITENSSKIAANETAINLKVDSQTYQSDQEGINTKLNKNTSDITAMKDEIALKVEASDIETAKGELEGSIDSKVNAAKAEIKITTDKISQNVSSLTTSVNNKADGSTVSTLSNKVGSLETSVNGIKGQVSSLETTTTSALNKANQGISDAAAAKSTADGKAKVFTASPTVPYKVGDIWTAGPAGDLMKCKVARSSGTYTASDWEKASKYTDDTKANAVDGKVNTLQGEVTTVKSDVATLDVNLKGITQRVSSTESTTATLTTDVSKAQSTADSKAKVFTSTPTVPYKVGDLWTGGPTGEVVRCKTARSSGSYTASDWEKAAKYTDDTVANAAKSQAEKNTTEISSTKSKVSTIETNLSGITSRVGTVETNQTTVNGKVTALETWKKTAEQKITDSSIISTVKSAKETNGKNTFAQQSDITQLNDSWTAKFSDGYNQGIVSMNKDGITVTSSGVKSKTSMSAAGFKITKTDTNEDVFKVNADGTLSLKGAITATSGTFTGSISGSTISGGSINIGNGNFTVNSSGTLTAKSANITGNINSGSTINGAIIKGGSFYTAADSTCTDGHAFRIYSDGRVYSKKAIQVYGNTADGDYSQLEPHRLTTTGYVQSSGYKTDNMTMYFAVDGAAVDNPTGNNNRRIKLTRNSEGNTYFAPDYPSTSSSSGIRLGTQNYMWNILYSKNGTSSSSDRNLKENIHYISNDMPNKRAFVKMEDLIAQRDLYNFVRDDLCMAQFNFIGDDETTVGFIAQDLLYNKDGSDNKIGQMIVNLPDEEQAPLTYNEKTYTNVLAGALREAILKIEVLENKIQVLENKTISK